jgi:hypothetical protein
MVRRLLIAAGSITNEFAQLLELTAAEIVALALRVPSERQALRRRSASEISSGYLAATISKAIRSGGRAGATECTDCMERSETGSDVP